MLLAASQDGEGHLPAGTHAIGGYWTRTNNHRSQLPGADDTTPLLAVTRSGCTADGVPTLTPEDLHGAWS
ncbi:hypothetical protein [Streptomyces brevispora]|uniref:Uncharacterized protein n=1 Tax=Streptomyces brevispora TaxID=887462 RepID=A0ABZ1G4E5_9ACTN|nr:hypothetical protein [Streptomyces brevispora]WSC14755.1 hypothetical protein OIE64_19215 [Streptomyces brevispora]